ncbi:MAG: hypothetical protein OEY38_20925, partial [Gammaproteobacteria bacterium]|nr:hypothetical protein [Gammaproteobacteria bacterium]
CDYIAESYQFSTYLWLCIHFRMVLFRGLDVYLSRLCLQTIISKKLDPTRTKHLRPISIGTEFKLWIKSN